MQPTREVREQLGRFALVRQVVGDDGSLDLVAACLRPARYGAGQAIVTKGEPGSQAFLLVRGTVEIVDFTMDGEPYVKAVLTESDALLFGELALVGGDVRTATVRARTDCECWVLEREDFLRLGEEHPRLGWLLLLEIARLLAVRLKRTNQDVLQLFEALVMEVEGGSR
ncbi:MAG: cyclic nucleotide-binding domain-containing protein [Candidatus Latescibacterota bacterium]